MRTLCSKIKFVSYFISLLPFPVLSSRVMVSHHHRSHHDDNDDGSDREVASVSSLPVSPSPGSSVTSSACTSPQPSLTQGLLPQQFASL